MINLSRHRRRAVLFGLLAIALAGCGVKGALELPADSRSAESRPPAGETDRHVANEPSVVQRAPSDELFPTNAPKEWEKMRPRAARPTANPPAKSDQPFALDWLL